MCTLHFQIVWSILWQFPAVHHMQKPWPCTFCFTVGQAQGVPWSPPLLPYLLQHPHSTPQAAGWMGGTCTVTMTQFLFFAAYLKMARQVFESIDVHQTGWLNVNVCIVDCCHTGSIQGEMGEELLSRLNGSIAAPGDEWLSLWGQCVISLQCWDECSCGDVTFRCDNYPPGVGM